MFSIIGEILFIFLIVLCILIIIGLPLGELTMGGKYKNLPKNLRIMAISQVLLQIFASIILLQSGSIIPLWFSFNVTRVICFIFASYFVLNTLMNLISSSKKERYLMTPISIMISICFFVTAFQM